MLWYILYQVYHSFKLFSISKMERFIITFPFWSNFWGAVHPSLRSLGWFPIKLNGSDIELELSKTELFLSKLYIELESRSKENFQVQI